jgi:hypothetical protein
MVQFYSTCAGGLPAAAEEWDLSQLLLESQPVQRSTVVFWLNAISQHGDDKPMFDEQPASTAHTMAGLAQLLAFADAVGTRRGLLLALDAQLSAAALVEKVQLGEQELQLAADSCYYFHESKPLDLRCFTASGTQTVATAGSAEEKERMRQQFVQQVEALLYLAYKLQLPQLQRVLRRCISCNSNFANSLLDVDAVRAVVSARVVDAAAGCSAAQDTLLVINGSDLCGFSSVLGRRQVLKPLDLSAAQKQPVQFKAELLEDLRCFKKGQIVHVELDLFGESRMTLHLQGAAAEGRATPFAVHLALGKRLLGLFPL